MKIKINVLHLQYDYFCEISSLFFLYLMDEITRTLGLDFPYARIQHLLMKVKISHMISNSNILILACSDQS